MIPLPYRLLAGLLVLLGTAGGCWWGGWHARGTHDEAAGWVAFNRAVEADATRVRTIDAGTLVIDQTFRVQLEGIRTTQAANIEEQGHAIDTTPALAACQLPAELVRLRARQAAASAALAGAGAGPGSARTVPGYDR